MLYITNSTITNNTGSLLRTVDSKIVISGTNISNNSAAIHFDSYNSNFFVDLTTINNNFAFEKTFAAQDSFLSFNNTMFDSNTASLITNGFEL